jgi:hypothetical protein
MKHAPTLFALAALLATSSAIPTASFAQDHDRGRWQGDANGTWDPADHYQSGRHRERRLGSSDRVYRGHDGRYYCRRSDGSTGLVIGAIGGAVLGNAIGGDTLGTLLGAGAGALAGRSIDRHNVRCR